MSETTEAGVVADLTRKSTETRVVLLQDGRQFLVTPEGFEVQDVTDPHGLIEAPPSRVRQQVTLQTVESLVEYGRRYGTSETMLFADMTASRILAVIDYHEAVPEPAGEESDALLATVAQANFAEHLAGLTLPFSVEWQTWAEIDGKMMSQLAFARFLEENSADIVAPSGAELLEVCRDLQALRTADFRSAVRTNTDAESFEFVVDTQARSRTTGDTVEIPTRFLLKIPVYFGDGPTEIYANLRWDAPENRIVLGVSLHRAEHVRQAQFRQHVVTASEEIGAPAVYGHLGAEKPAPPPASRVRI